MAKERNDEATRGAPFAVAEQSTRRGLERHIQEAIGRSLKQHYEDLAREPIPDRFLALLAELEAKEKQRGK